LDAISRLFSQALLALGALVLSRSALALAHAHGWYPEKQIADLLMRLKARVHKLAWRLAAQYERPPDIKDAPGLVWRRRKDGWMAVWQARPDLVKRGYRPKNVKLVLAKEFSQIEKVYVSDLCVFRQAQFDILRPIAAFYS